MLPVSFQNVIVFHCTPERDGILDEPVGIPQHQRIRAEMIHQGTANDEIAEQRQHYFILRVPVAQQEARQRQMRHQSITCSKHNE